MDRAIREADWQPRPLDTVVDIAKGINQIRLNHGEEPERLTQSFGYSHVHGDSTYIDESWGRTNPLRFTPTSLASVAADIRNGVVSSRLATFWCVFLTSLQTDHLAQVMCSYIMYRAALIRQEHRDPACEQSQPKQPALAALRRQFKSGSSRHCQLIAVQNNP